MFCHSGLFVFILSGHFGSFEVILGQLKSLGVILKRFAVSYSETVGF